MMNNAANRGKMASTHLLPFSKEGKILLIHLLSVYNKAAYKTTNNSTIANTGKLETEAHASFGLDKYLRKLSSTLIPQALNKPISAKSRNSMSKITIEE